MCWIVSGQTKGTFAPKAHRVQVKYARGRTAWYLIINPNDHDSPSDVQEMMTERATRGNTQSIAWSKLELVGKNDPRGLTHSFVDSTKTLPLMTQTYGGKMQTEQRMLYRGGLPVRLYEGASPALSIAAR